MVMRRLFTRSKRRAVRYGLLVLNVLLLGGVVFFVTSSRGAADLVRQQVIASDANAVSPLDQLSSADIAVHVAHLVDLQEMKSVENHADSFNEQLASVSSGDSTIVVPKPQIVSTPSIKTKRDIASYTVQSGESVNSIADKFGVSDESIRWSNGLTGNTVAAGKVLTIPPINGIVYTVLDGDTVDKLAQKYGANKAQIIEFNDAEVAGLKVGEKILIPNGVVASARGSGSSAGAFSWGGLTPIYSGNGYDYGWCTWWAAKRRQDIGRPIPSNLGNANTWASRARKAGLSVDTAPQAGDVAFYRTIGGLGHVGFVEKVNPDGSIWVSDMNYRGVSQIGGTVSAGGWGRASYHLVTPGGSGANGLSGFYFIH